MLLTYRLLSASSTVKISGQMAMALHASSFNTPLLVLQFIYFEVMGMVLPGGPVRSPVYWMRDAARCPGPNCFSTSDDCTFAIVNMPAYIPGVPLPAV